MGSYEKIKVLSSSISHMPLHAVFRPLQFDRVEGQVIAPLFTRPV